MVDLVEVVVEIHQVVVQEPLDKEIMVEMVPTLEVVVEVVLEHQELLVTQEVTEEMVHKFL